MSRHKGDPSLAERIICAVLLAMSAAVFAFVVLVWWAQPAHATRIVPGRAPVDVCANVRGTQTILDITTGHRFRVVAVTPRGNVCRPVWHR